MGALLFHSIHTALSACCSRPIAISENTIQSPCKSYEQPQHLHNDPCVGPRSSFCFERDLTVRLWRTYDNLIALLLELRAMAVILSMLKVRAVVRLSMRSHSVRWRCHCVAAEMLAIILHTPRRSAFFMDALHFSLTP